MKENFLGNFKLGLDNVRLYEVDADGSAASFEFGPDDDGCPKMCVNLRGVPFGDVISGVLHECVESVLNRKGNGFRRTHTPRETSETYIFVLSHADLDQAIDWASNFLDQSAYVLKTRWNKLNKIQNNSRKRK